MTRTFKALGVWILLVSSAISVQAQNISVNIVQPSSGSIQDTPLTVVATVSSVYQVQSLKAVVEGRQIDLTYSDCAYRFRGITCGAGWIGSLSLAGLARGDKTLTVTATDVRSGTGSAQVSFTYDQKPVLTVSAPLDETVARPNLRVTATCTDDDPAGCSSLKVFLQPVLFSSTGGLAASGTAALDQDLSLAAYDGQVVVVHFEATDSRGQTVFTDCTVFVESSIRVTEIEAVAGHILDVQPDRIVFLQTVGTAKILKIHNRSSGQDTEVPAVAGKTPQYGFLTPKGAIFEAEGDTVTTARLYEWRDGVIVDLGYPDSSTSLKVAGNFAIWNGPGSSASISLFVRDLPSGTNTELTAATGIGNINNDVATNGDVVYWSSGAAYNIYRYRAGTTAQLTNDSTIQNVYPLTDGTNVIYRKGTEIALYQSSGETILTPGRTQGAEPRRDYQVSNGHFAYTRRASDGTLQVWVDGTQISDFGSSSEMGSVAPNGQVTFVNGRSLYLGFPGKSYSRIGTALGESPSTGRSFWQSGSWFVTIGRSLFQVDRPANFYTVTPCRVVDTRNSMGPLGGPALSANTDRIFKLAGQCGVPATARAVSVNIAVVQPDRDGDLRIFPSGTALPLTSVINYRAGQTRASNAVLSLNAAGELAARCDQVSETVHLILDVNGYFQ